MPGEDPSFVCLVVLDGWGLAPPGPGNAIILADTPNLDKLFEKYPHTTLNACGESVGLPAGQMGNSEVGHLNLGAGRVVYQDLTRINKAIEDCSFFDNSELLKAFNRVREAGRAMHLLGLLSDGGVHSELGHLKALIDMAKRQGCRNLFLHLFLDGRDVSPRSGIGYVEEIAHYANAEGLGRIATICGRYFAMDRDNRWDRVELAYNAMVYGKGPHQADPLQLMRDSYARDVTDEFVIPTIIDADPDSRIGREDGVIFFNFRPDRARELTRALTSSAFDGFNRGSEPPLPNMVTFTEYDASFTSPIAFPPADLKNVLAAVLSESGKTQLHIAETEKYAHVTFFFNGGEEKVYPGETRKLIPSPADVPTYDRKPEMSARQVADTLIELLNTQHFDFVVINFANCDMVGHTGNLGATIKAVEVVDECVGKVVTEVLGEKGICLITADHGNAESMTETDGCPDTAHTTESVPLIVTAMIALADGCALGDVAPAILKLLHLPIPSEMTGRCLVSGMGGGRA